MIYSLTRRAALIGGACAAMLTLTSAPSQAAAKIQRLVSPGGIEAWFVQDATVPLIAMEYSFAGGASQDPPGKPGVGNLVADLLDEGSGDLDSKTYHERSSAAPSSSASSPTAISSAARCACSRTTRTKPTTCCGWR